MEGDGLTWQERRRRRKLLEGIDATWYRDCPLHGPHMPVDPYDDTKLVCCSPPLFPGEIDYSDLCEEPPALEENIYRASGEMVCSCGMPYWKHPAEEYSWALAAEDPCTLRRLCNGDLVKL